MWELIVPVVVAGLTWFIGYGSGYETAKRVWRMSDLPPRTRYKMKERDD